MAHAEKQAFQLVTDAEKKLTPKGFFQSIFGFHRNRTEEAIECYQKAGNLFKLAKNWLQASTAFKMAGDLNVEQNNRSEAANNYVQASKCLEKYDTDGAIKILLSAVEIYTDLGRFTLAARLHNNIAEIYEQNLELNEAVQHYEQAADYFKVEENYSSAKKCLLKVADYSSSEFNDFVKAVDIYQEIAFSDLKTPILRYSVKDSLFKAVLCHLCIDIMNAKHALNAYLHEYPDFETTVQYGFLAKIIETIEESNIDAFSNTVKEYDNLSRLDTWYVKILLHVRKQINEQPNLL